LRAAEAIGHIPVRPFKNGPQRVGAATQAAGDLVSEVERYQGAVDVVHRVEQPLGFGRLALAQQVEDAATQLAGRLGQSVEPRVRLGAEVFRRGQRAAAHHSIDQIPLHELLDRILGIAGEVQFGIAAHPVDQILGGGLRLGQQGLGRVPLLAMNGPDRPGAQGDQAARAFVGQIARAIDLLHVAPDRLGRVVQFIHPACPLHRRRSHRENERSCRRCWGGAGGAARRARQNLGEIKHNFGRGEVDEGQVGIDGSEIFGQIDGDAILFGLFRCWFSHRAFYYPFTEPASKPRMK